MEKHTHRCAARDRLGVALAVAAVFGLSALMVLRSYDPAVIGMVVATTGLTAAELASRFRHASRATADEGGRDS